MSTRDKFGALPKNLASAIDLSGLGKPAQAAVPTSAVAVNQNNLMTEILPSSRVKPVIMLCWSPRSTQSAELIKTLDQLAQQDSRWTLTTLNVDDQPQVATALQVASVPFALALLQEQIVPLFDSVPPVEQVAAVIEKLMEIAASQGMTIAAKAPAAGPAQAPEVVLEPEEASALAAFEAGEFAAAAASFRAWLQRSPANQQAQAGLAQAELFVRIDGKDFAAAVAVSNESPDDVAAALLAADFEVAYGQAAAGFTRLTLLIKQKNSEERTKIREHLLSLFQVLEPSDPILTKARSQLASALY